MTTKTKTEAAAAAAPNHNLAALILVGAAGLFGYRKLDAERKAAGKDSLSSAICRRAKAEASKFGDQTRDFGDKAKAFGEDFNEKAKTYSEDVAAKAKGFAEGVTGKPDEPRTEDAKTGATSTGAAPKPSDA